jgi:glycine betaine/proline transport system permease protein
VLIPKLPLAEYIERAISWVHVNIESPFGALGAVILGLEGSLRIVLLATPPLVLVAVTALVVYRLAGGAAALLSGLGLLLVWNLHLWQAAIETLSLVVVASGLSVLIGIPLGILVAENRTVRVIVTPILDYMQATPSFVYLIPNVLFFGLGTVPGVLATLMFALPPPVRITALGIAQTDRDVIEAAEAFGCSRWQILRKIKLPLAVPSILLAVNQCILMALSLVVIAALIGARGLGTKVIEAITQVDISAGVEAGVAVVILAMVLDRMTRGVVRERPGRGWL